MKLVAQSIGVRSWLEVPAKDITMQGSKGPVEIKPPHTGLGYKPLRLLLLSHKWREGQVGCMCGDRARRLEMYASLLCICVYI
jgi:hypothetical protein